MKQNETNLMPKNAEIFYCEKCDFKCSKKSNYNKHLTTAKHKMKQNETKKMPKNADSLHNFICEHCCNEFQSRTTLWRHKKNCKINIKKSATLDKKSATLDKKSATLDKKSATLDKKSATTDKNDTNNQVNIDKIDNDSMYVGVINKLMTDNNDLRQFIMEQSKELRLAFDNSVEVRESYPYEPEKLFHTDASHQGNRPLPAHLLTGPRHAQPARLRRRIDAACSPGTTRINE